MPREIRTLLIDDRESDADYVRSFLQKLSSDYTFRTTWESDPTRALLRLTQELFDLVLLDYQMPSMSGLDVLSTIRQANRTLPVIMLTGMGDERIAVEAMKRGAHDYLKKDEMNLADLACAIITVLQRKHLENQLEDQRRLADQDLRMAREMQQAFLPQSFPHFAPQQTPDAMGLRFYHHYTPTLSVGGDFFDVVPIDDHSAGIFVSDVAGHGIQAALVTAALRTLIEELKDVAGDPGEFLTEVNSGLSRILRQTTTPLYASAFYLKIDLAEKRASFANAGHPPQLHLRRKREEVERLFDKSKTGPALGMVSRGELQIQLQELAAKKWRHPITGEWTLFGFSTLERWYYRALRSKAGPVEALKRKIRSDHGQHPSLSPQLAQVLAQQYRQHPNWSYQLHADNLAVLVAQEPRWGRCLRIRRSGVT